MRGEGEIAGGWTARQGRAEGERRKRQGSRFCPRQSCYRREGAQLGLRTTEFGQGKGTWQSDGEGGERKSRGQLRGDGEGKHEIGRLDGMHPPVWLG